MGGVLVPVGDVGAGGVAAVAEGEVDGVVVGDVAGVAGDALAVVPEATGDGGGTTEAGGVDDGATGDAVAPTVDAGTATGGFGGGGTVSKGVGTEGVGDGVDVVVAGVDGEGAGFGDAAMAGAPPAGGRNRRCCPTCSVYGAAMPFQAATSAKARPYRREMPYSVSPACTVTPSSAGIGCGATGAGAGRTGRGAGRAGAGRDAVRVGVVG